MRRHAFVEVGWCTASENTMVNHEPRLPQAPLKNGAPLCLPKLRIGSFMPNPFLSLQIVHVLDNLQGYAMPWTKPRFDIAN